MFTEGCPEKQEELQEVKTGAGGSDRGRGPDAPQGERIEIITELLCCSVLVFVLFVQFEDDGSSGMQKLAVQTLCYQLDTTWQYFTRTFKMQVKSLPNFLWDKTS